MLKFLKILSAVLLLLAVVYLVGPRVSFPEIKINSSSSTIDLNTFLIEKNEAEQKIKNLKPGNQSFLIWADSLNKAKTEYVLLFLHGFSASPMEGMPVVSKLAKTIGANMYAPLISGHGTSDKNTFKNVQPQEWIDSAVQAYMEAKELGQKVIIASSSTGGTLSIILAAEFPEIHSLLLYSPNIDLYDTNSELILKPWGNQILNLIMGGSYKIIDHYTEAQEKYWNEIYHTDGIVALKSLLKETMTQKRFEKIKQPVFVGCYFKNDDQQDEVVSIERMRDFYNQVSTSKKQKNFVALPEAKNHVLTSDLFYQDNDFLIQESLDFLRQEAGVERVLSDSLID